MHRLPAGAHREPGCPYCWGVRKAGKAGMLSQGSSSLPQSTPNLTTGCQKETIKEERHTWRWSLSCQAFVWDLFLFLSLLSDIFKISVKRCREGLRLPAQRRGFAFSSESVDMLQFRREMSHCENVSSLTSKLSWQWDPWFQIQPVCYWPGQGGFGTTQRQISNDSTASRSWLTPNGPG